MNAFKKQCVELRKQDYSLPEIVKITRRPKTSVYFHIRNIPLSDQKLQEARKIYTQRIININHARKGKSERPFHKFDNWDKNTVSLVAHLMFDGEIKKNGCAYNNRSIVLVERVEQCMTRIYKFKPIRYYDKITGVYKTNYFNVALSIYLKKRSEELLDQIMYLPRSLKLEFILAFFDDEGCMDYKPETNKRRVRGYQKNVDILKLIQKLLTSFKIHSVINYPNEIAIGKRQNLLKFQKIINFSKGVFVNGDRSNSVWKTHLEKREILKMALASYQ